MYQGKNGVTEQTAKSILFGAGTVHKGLKYTEGTGWNFAESVIGATNGGSKLSIVPEFYDIPVDGLTVQIKELKRKVGEKATLDINLIEIPKDIIRDAIIGKYGESADADYDLIESKANLAEGDFVENIAFVGEKLDGTNIIVILDNALCTSGYTPDNKNKDASTITFTYECHATIRNFNDGTLPYHIYYPKGTSNQQPDNQQDEQQDG